MSQLLAANDFAFIPLASLESGPRVINAASRRYATPSFFCRLDDEVVYWNVSFLSG
jgi:hypothetical protein